MGRKGFSNHAIVCSFIVIKCIFLADKWIAHSFGFDISGPLPSYWTFDRLLKIFDNDILSNIMKSYVLLFAEEGIVDTSFIGFDSTPVAANTSQNNPKSFLSNEQRD